MASHLRRNHFWLIVAVAAVAFLPLIGAIPRWGGLPPTFWDFPPAHAGAPKPGFSWLIFGAGVLGALVIVLFLAAPKLFGFRDRGTRRRPDRRPLPFWFWIGLFVNAASWVLHWFGPLEIAQYTFIPLWWGAIVAVDGIVYSRANGRSMLRTETKRFLVIALMSIPGWGLFEFFNHYGADFWVYPVDGIFSHTKQVIWYLLSFSVVLPAIFEWYTLLHTFDGLWNRWSRGPKIEVPRRAMLTVLAVGFVALILFGAFPFGLFPLFWVGPPLVLTAVLALLGFWTPFEPIRRHGNWSPAVIVGLSSFINGLFWEVWNFGSNAFHQPAITNPNYWYYDIPYVNRFFVFSEMPVLGFFGYLPYGFLAWVTWLVAAHLLDMRPNFDLTPEIGAGGPAVAPRPAPPGDALQPQPPRPTFL